MEAKILLDGTAAFPEDDRFDAGVFPWRIVKRGDTLSQIAQAHDGDAIQYPRIFEANRPLLRDPDEIYPGQTLRIPQ